MIRVILLSDDENAIHPLTLPYKDGKEPLVGIQHAEDWTILSEDILNSDPKEEILRYVIGALYGVRKNHMNFLYQKGFESYRDAKRALTKLLGSQQASYIDFKKSDSGDLIVEFYKSNERILNAFINMVKSFYEKQRSL